MLQSSEASSLGEETLQSLAIATREYLDRHRASVVDLVNSGSSGLAAAKRQCTVMDGLLSALYLGAVAASGIDPNDGDNRIALLGLGGLGRGLVGVHSDLDLLFLADRSRDGRVHELVGLVVSALQRTGFDVVHTVREVDEVVELARVDIRTATALVDLRRLNGDADLVAELQRRGRKEVFEGGLSVFLDLLEQDIHERHERCGRSLVAMEPDVKLGKGGLRDVDVGRWAARARWKVGDIDGLVRTGALLAAEADELQDARESVWRVRNLLHLRAAGRQDVLRFGDQVEIAATLGFGSGDRISVERFMQTYHRNARTIAQMSERLLTRARPIVPPKTRSAAKQVAPGLIQLEDWIELRDARDLQADPSLAFRLFDVCLGMERRPGATARDSVSQMTQDEAWCARLRNTPDARRLFRKLLTHTDKTGWHADSVLTELHSVGLLTAMVPEFVSAVGRVRYDVYNVHTVDVHAIRAADVLRALVRGEHASKWPTASSIAADSTRLEPLFLACTLQEIGLEPDITSRAPVASLTREVGKRLGFTDADANHAAFLARNQMKLYVAATRRDVLDPSLIAEVARWAKSVEQLRDLYLLCFANLWATNSTMMTEWKSDLLTRLGELVARQLEGEPLDTSENRVRTIRREVRVGFMGEPEVEELEAYLEDMSPRYLLGNEVEAIREHAFTAVQRHAGAAIVREVRLPIGGRREIVIVADERRGFLADVSVCLAKHGISVLGAQVYARKRRRRSPEVVGLFELEPAGYAETISDEVIKELQEDLTSIVAGEVDAETFLQMNAASERTPSSSIQVSTKVVLSNDATSESTLVDVYTQDRPGVLYAITRAIRDLNIEILFARINTEGVRVVDAFYVTEADGRKIVDQDRLRVLRESIVHSLYAEMKR